MFTVRRATPSDAAQLGALARVTFPLACPPSATPEVIETFMNQNLSEDSFAKFLADPEREIFVAEQDETASLIGYVMGVTTPPADEAVSGSLQSAASYELNKVYAHPDVHGTGVAQALIEKAVERATELGFESLWLGVNQENVRAQKFYAKMGFQIVGDKTFQLGPTLCHDFVVERHIAER